MRQSHLSNDGEPEMLGSSAWSCEPWRSPRNRILSRTTAAFTAEFPEEPKTSPTSKLQVNAPGNQVATAPKLLKPFPDSKVSSAAGVRLEHLFIRRFCRRLRNSTSQVAVSGGYTVILRPSLAKCCQNLHWTLLIRPAALQICKQALMSTRSA